MKILRQFASWVLPTTNHRRHFLALFLFGILLSSGPMVARLTRNASELASLQQGVTTCWPRTTQTFMALLARQYDSHYLGKSFTGMTQECWGDVIASFDSSFLSQDEEISKNLQQLALTVFNFNQNVQRKVSANNAIPFFPLYQQIEKNYLTLLNSFETHSMKINESQEQIFLPFLVALMLALVLQGMSFWREKKLYVENSLLEHEAFSEVKREEMVSGVRVEEVLKRAFTLNHLPACSSLFIKYHSFLLEEAMLRVSATHDQEQRRFGEVWNGVNNNNREKESENREKSENREQLDSDSSSLSV